MRVKNLSVRILLVMMIFMMSGCSLIYFGRLLAPSEAYWGKKGYSLKQTYVFMRDVCGFKQWRSNEEHTRENPNFQRCMLDNGFVYLTDFHKITRHGYRPLDFSRCDKDPRIPYDFYNTPACKSYRGEPYK